MQGLAPTRRRRRPSLTPMIDVVFLLLVFFMLASRFGIEQVMPLPLGGAAAYSGPPRLVDIGPDGLWLNGRATAPEALVNALAPMMDTASDTIVLRARDGAALQEVVSVADRLRAAGYTTLVLVE